MLCSACNKLALVYTNKKCIRCHGDVLIAVCILCPTCAISEHQCEACLKKIITPQQRASKGCNCGRR